MRKGERTRKFIIEQAAQLISLKGYFGCSMNDIIEATGIQKGGIYKYFDSKDQIALEAFDYSFDLIKERLLQSAADKTTAKDKLVALISVYGEIIIELPLQGGCPLLNTAVESDDTHEELRKKAVGAADQWRILLHSILLTGIQEKEFIPDLDVEECISFVIGSIEGAVMLSKLYDDPVHMKRTIRSLTRYVDASVVRKA